MKKPKDAYIFFLDVHVQELMKSEPYLKLCEAWGKWKSMTDEEKQPYLDMQKSSGYNKEKKDSEGEF